MTLGPVTGGGSPWWIWFVVFAPLGLSLLLVLWCWTGVSEDVKLMDRVGPPAWDFSQSFASNLTVFASVLGAILSAGVLPDTSTVPAGTYAGLNLLFGVMVVLGPFVYVATQTPEQVHRESTVTEPQYHGFVWSFLVATAVTLWAVGGELATIGLVFNEIRLGHSMPAGIVWVLVAVLAVAGTLLCVLAQRRTADVLADEVDVPSTLASRQQELHQRLTAQGVVNIPSAEQLKPALRGWAVL